MINDPGFDKKMTEKLSEIASGPDGRMLFAIKTMQGGTFKPLIMLLKPTMRGAAKQLINNLDISGFVS